MLYGSIRKRRPFKYSIGYESLTEPFAAKQFKAVLYGHFKDSPEPEPLVESPMLGSKEHAALSLAHRCLRAGYQPGDLPTELSAAVLVAAEESVEYAEEHLNKQRQIRDAALATLKAAKGTA